MPDDYKSWSYFGRAVYDGNRLAKYTIAFYRAVGDAGDGWYDEIRYDSHDRRAGRLLLAPHLHLKIRSAMKQGVEAAVAEIKEIIDNDLEGIEKVAFAEPPPPGDQDAEDVSE